MGGEAAVVREAPAGGDRADGGNGGVGDSQIVVGVIEVDPAQVSERGGVEVAAERGLRAAYTDAGCGGAVRRGLPTHAARYTKPLPPKNAPRNAPTLRVRAIGASMEVWICPPTHPASGCKQSSPTPHTPGAAPDNDVPPHNVTPRSQQPRTRRPSRPGSVSPTGGRRRSPFAFWTTTGSHHRFLS